MLAPVDCLEPRFCSARGAWLSAYGLGCCVALPARTLAAGDASLLVGDALACCSQGRPPSVACHAVLGATSNCAVAMRRVLSLGLARSGFFGEVPPRVANSGRPQALGCWLGC